MAIVNQFLAGNLFSNGINQYTGKNIFFLQSVAAIATGSAKYSTLQLNGVSYQVPVGKTLVVVAFASNNDTASTYIPSDMAYSDNAVSSSTSLTNPVSLMPKIFSQPSSSQLNYYPCLVKVPAQKYLNLGANVGSGTAYLMGYVFCYLE